MESHWGAAQGWYKEKSGRNKELENCKVMTVNMSQSEIEFIRNSARADIRVDGRSTMKYRELEFERDVIEQANGSVRMRLGRTEVIVGVKCELGEPDASSPNSGRINVLIKQVGAAIERDIQMERMIEVSLCNAGKSMMEELCVVKGRLAWNIYVDAVVIEDDGNVLDCVSIAARIALLNTPIPIVHVISGDSDVVQIDLNRDDVQFMRFKSESLPICVSLVKVRD